MMSINKIERNPKSYFKSRLLFFVFFLFLSLAFGQDKSLQKKILKFEKELKNPKSSERKLEILDSLIVWYADEHYNPKIENTYALFEKEVLNQSNILDYSRLIHNGNILTQYYLNFLNQPNDALAFSNKVKKWLKFSKNNEVKGNFYLERGNVYYNLFMNDSAVSCQRTAQKFYKKSKNNNIYFTSKSYEAISLLDMGQYVKASILLDSCFLFFETQKDTAKMFDVLNSKTIILGKLNLYKEANNKRVELLKYTQGNPLKLVLLHINLGTDESKQGNREATISNYKLALKYVTETEYVDYITPVILSALSEKLFEYGRVEEGEMYFNKIKNEYDVTNSSFSKYYKDAEIQYYISKNDYQSALNKLLELLPFVYNSKNFEDIKNTEKQLASVYETLNEPKLANFHYKKYFQIKDSLDNIAKLNSLFYYQSLYENQKREHTLKEQSFKISDLTQKNEYQRTAIFGLLIFGFLIGISIFLGFKQYQTRKEANLKEAFSQDLIQMQEQQKTHLAFELHDGIGQRLTFLKQKLQASNQEENSNLIAQILEETRHISRSLYPAILSQVGISEAIKSLIDDIDETSTMFFTHDIEDIDGFFSKDQELNIYRFVQESLGNVVKHSKATEVLISIKKETHSIKIEIEDNGVGFDLSSKLQYSKSLGIRTMKERINMLKGVLNIKSIQGKFTKIQVILNT